MTERSLKYLNDILISIALIEDFTLEINDFNSYERDKKTQSAVERQLAVIGEALSQIRKFDTSVVINHDKQIIAFRNRLIHAYDSVDNSIVWAIIKKHLSPLKNEVVSLLK